MKKNLLNTFNRAQKKTQRGISTVQVAVTILVGSILIVGGLGAFRYVTGAQMNNDASDIIQWAVKTKELGATQGGAFFSNTGNFPTTALVATDPLAVNGFYTIGRGAFTASGKGVVASAINTDTATATNPNGIRLVVTSYDQNECREIIPKIAASVVTVNAGATGATNAVTRGILNATGLAACVVGANILVVDMRM